MTPFSEITTLMYNRASLYALLARLYRVEVDQALLDQMTTMNLAVAADDGDIENGYHLLGNYLHQMGADVVTDLAVDYARVFLGAGIVNGKAAFPYESVYTSPDHLIMQDARDRVLECYYAQGLDEADDLGVPEDHICLELEFMARLCHKTHDALVAGEVPAALQSLQAQQSFLQAHLQNWVPAFCADICRYAETDFYIAAAKITLGLLKMEAPLIAQLIAETQELCPAPSVAA